MKSKISLLFLLPFLFLVFNFSFSNQTFATIRYVSKTGSSIPPYTNWATAADSIQKCINISQAGDTIYVANGVYKELIVMISGLALIGAGMDSCIIDTRGIASSYYDGVIVKDSCLFKGFQVIASNQIGNGIKALGQSFVNEKGLITMNKIVDGVGGIWVFDSDITVKENFCLNNYIGIIIDYSNSLVTENHIYSNQKGKGIEIFDLAHLYCPVIQNNFIETNGTGISSVLGPRSLIIINNIITVAEVGWGIIIGNSTDTARVFNNLIMAKNSHSNLGGIGISNQPRFISNNLILGNYESEGTGIAVNGTNLNLVEILNNLIIGGEYGIYSDNNPSGTLPAFYNNIWKTGTKSVGFTLDSTNLSVDPMLVNDDPTQGELDFHLQMFSPLIDAGDPNITDLDGTRSDIGLYGGPFGRRYIYQDLPPKVPVNLSATVDSGFIKLSWNRNTESDTSYYN
ncbi:MAG: right-handed parallel beta-helix repeat-containing protein, partial [Ignavibacterium sp.]